MKTRVLKRKCLNGTTLTVTLKRKTVIVEGTVNGVDVDEIKLKRERGWRERFQVIVGAGKKRQNETTIQARIPSAASC